MAFLHEEEDNHNHADEKKEYGAEDKYLSEPQKAHFTGEFVIVAKFGGHVSQTHPACILDVSHMHSGHFPHQEKKAWNSYRSCCSFIARSGTCMDASHAHSGRVLLMTQRRRACISDTSCMHFRRMRTLP